MLGFTVSVNEVDRKERGPSIAYWYAEPHFLSEIEKLIEDGKAVVVEYHGGYPNKYEVNSEVLREWLEEDDPRLQRMHRFSDIYRLTLDYDRLDAVPDGVMLAVEIWDQS